MNLFHHPFAVRGRIERCWLFTYRTPAESVRALLPAPLAPLVHGGFAFWNIVVCRLRGMRPPAVPKSLGLNYWHVAYRLHARATRQNGKPIEGVFFVRSDCDHPLVAHTGNWLTDFHFHLARIRVSESSTAVEGEIVSRDASAHFRINPSIEPRLAANSPFSYLEEAVKALEYQPCALNPRDARSLQIVRVQRDSSAWRSRLRTVDTAHWQVFAEHESTLELCHEVAPIDYLWERGQIIQTLPCAS